MARKIRYKDQYKLNKRRRFIRKVLFVSCCALVLLFVAGYLLFFAKLFDVRGIKVAGAQENSELNVLIPAHTDSWLNQKKFFFQRRRNIFFINVKELETRLMNENPKIDSIDISRKLPHELLIEIKERSPEGIWCVTRMSQCFYFNKDGIIYENAPQTSGFLVLTVQDEKTAGINLGDKVVEQEWLKAISLTHGKLISKGFKIKTTVIPENSFDEFYILTSSGLRVIISLDTDIESQLEAMIDFMDHKFNAEQRTKLQYIDLRIRDRIYYK